eukprot:4809517-Amphidinium_carterae.1
MAAFTWQDGGFLGMAALTWLGWRVSWGVHGCWLHGSPDLMDIFLVWESALTWLGWRWDGRFDVAGKE